MKNTTRVLGRSTEKRSKQAKIGVLAPYIYRFSNRYAVYVEMGCEATPLLSWNSQKCSNLDLNSKKS